MAESAAAEETRVAEAVARLLARQSSLLARATDDAAAASATRLGLSWLTDLMRSFDLHGAADWFQALRAKGEERGSTAAWPALGAPLCEALAGEVSRAGGLAPLGSDAQDWGGHVARVGTFEEPEVARDPGPPSSPEIEPEPMPEPLTEPRPVPPPREEPPAPTAPEIEPPRDPEPRPEADAHAALFEAIADLAGEGTPEIDASRGRIEITGRRALPEGGMDAGSHVLLEALDRAAQAAGAVLLASTDSGSLGWIVRLPRPEAGHYLFAEIAGAPIAVPWSRVVGYGLAQGSARPRIVVGNGLGRIDLSIDWLFRKGEGRPVGAPPDAGAIALPASFTIAGWVEDAEGRTARVLDLGSAPDLAPSAEAPTPEAPPSESAPEAVQPEPVPADTSPETAPPARAPLRALVADDSMMARVFLGRLLAQRGIVVEEAEDGAAARALIDRGGFDLVFLDAEMPGAGALEILKGADAAVVARACVLVKDDEERRRAEAFGGLPILYKPFAEDEVRSAVDTLRARSVPGS